MEIAVVGNSDFVIGFRLAGIRKTYETAPEIWRPGYRAC